MNSPPLRIAPVVAVRPLIAAEADELFSLTLAQGSDLDGFAWRSKIHSPQDELAFIAWAQQAESQGHAWTRAIVVDGRLAGCASLYRPHPGAFAEDDPPDLQMGYWLGREFRGQGLAAQAMGLLALEASNALPATSRVGIRCRSKNAASIGAAAKLGLTSVAGGLPSMFDPADVDVAMEGSLMEAAKAAPSSPLVQPMPAHAPVRSPGLHDEPPEPARFAGVIAKQAPHLAGAVSGSLSGLREALLEMNSRGQALLPVEIELLCDEGALTLFGDFLPVFLSHPACEGFAARNFLTLLLGACSGALRHHPPAAGRLDPFHFGHLSRETDPATDALAFFLAQSCPAWRGGKIAARAESPSSHEPWLNDTHLLFARVRAPEGDASSSETEVELLWSKRRDQALALAGHLGASFAWEDWDGAEKGLRPRLWASFAADVKARPARAEAALLAKEASPAAPRSALRRI